MFVPKKMFERLLSALSCSFAFTTAGFTADHPVLKPLSERFAKDIATKTCCPEDSGERCLEILTRNDTPDATNAACVWIAGLPQFQKHNVALDATCPDKNPLGIQIKDFRRYGWWQDGPPAWMTQPTQFRSQSVAASSTACIDLLNGKPALKKKAAQCSTTGYETVHLYIALNNEISDRTYAEQISEADPWWNAAATKNKVFLVRTDNILEVHNAVLELLSQCKIASFIDVASHGVPGEVTVSHVGPGNLKNHFLFSITSFLRNFLTPCVLAPSAKVQFTGCSMACGIAAEPIKNGLEKIFRDKSFWPFADVNPFNEVSLLFPTSNATISWETSFNLISLFRKTLGLPNLKFETDDGEGLVYTFQDGHMKTDVSTSKVTACDRGALNEVPDINAVLDMVSKGN